MTDTCYPTMTPQPFSTDPMLTNTIESRQSATMGKFFSREIDYRITNIYPLSKSLRISKLCLSSSKYAIGHCAYSPSIMPVSNGMVLTNICGTYGDMIIQLVHAVGWAPHSIIIHHLARPQCVLCITIGEIGD